MPELKTTALLFCFLTLAFPAWAGGWNPTLGSHAQGPKTMLVIDKASQTLYMFGRHSPLEVLRKLPCSTGQSDGDKVQRGDLRTPEGIYFIQGQLDRGLEWELYGDVAYPLNYPNPVDRIRGKTGSGIWLHGRGKNLVPKDTRGCVALANPNIHALDGELSPGMPVVIADKVAWTEDEGPDGPEANILTDKVREWAEDWQDRSEEFFAHYLPEAMPYSGIEFNGFRDHKKGIFARQPWIQVMVDNVYAMHGPGYWVTWFDQYYRTPSMTSTVGKRLYWQQSDDGNWRIVGREVTKPSEDLTEKYIQNKTEQVRSLVATWAEDWLKADAAGYATHYDEDAVQDSRRGIKDIANYKATLWAKRAPTEVVVENLNVQPHGQGLQATFIQTYSDASGYQDKGVKTLILRPSGKGWLIVNEQWRAL
ncbi:MAG: L,D-transpeptidase family protein [Desulfovibrionaceae bacterium]